MGRVVAIMFLMTAVSAASSAAPVKVERNSKALEFSYEWPSAAAAVPLLNKRFRADLDTAFKRASADARDDQKLAQEQKREFHPHFYSMSWTNAGQSAALLSLESELGTFTGGAHPNSVDGALLWNRRLGREIKFIDQFIQPAAFSKLVRAPYCKKLDAERLKRREGEKIGGEFDECPPFSELAIAPADSDKDSRFDIIRFTASPYSAGPYAEGEYVLELPVTRQLMAALKPVYRSSYELQRQ